MCYSINTATTFKTDAYGETFEIQSVPLKKYCASWNVRCVVTTKSELRYFNTDLIITKVNTELSEKEIEKFPELF